jgi:Holliday junction DNA helicase RuvB
MVLARRAKGVPRLALHLAELAADFAAIDGLDRESPYVSEDVAIRAMEAFGIGELGLTAKDREVLEILASSAAPIGLDQLSQRADMEALTLKDEVEPPLMRLGLIARTPQGRMITSEGFDLVQSWQEIQMG